jgi:hypothetical protein
VDGLLEVPRLAVRETVDADGLALPPSVSLGQPDLISTTRKWPVALTLRETTRVSISRA